MLVNGTKGLLVAALAAVLGSPAPRSLQAQSEITARNHDIRFGGRLHSQFATSSAEGGKSTDFFTRRARFTLDVSVSDLLDARVQPDFGGGELDVKDAYFRLNLDPGLRLSLGQVKRAFDIFELNSSTDIVVVERTGRIDGVGGCSGPGGLCTLSHFTEKLGYSDRDVGLKMDGAIGNRVSYMATLTNGTGTSGSDENSGKSGAGRVSVGITDQVRIAANVSRHDYVDDNAKTRSGTGFGADLEVGGFRDGTHLQVGLIGGANWRVATPSGDSPQFLTGQAILSHYVPTSRSTRLAGVEPMVRVSWGDPDREAGGDAAWLLTPGFFIYVIGKNRIGLNLDVYRPQSHPAQHSFKLQTYLYY